MFKRVFSVFFLLGTWSIVASDKIEITANHILASKTKVSAKNGVVVYYDDAVIKANTASFDKEKKLLILDGNIEMIGYKGTKEHSNHIEIYTKKKEVTFDELFLMADNDVWLYATNAHKKDGNYTLGASMLSSCDVVDPLWKLTFSRSYYDSNLRYMKVYDAKMYMWDVPLFYTPYLAFSTNKERSSGLLFPALGYSKFEGFLYEQPIYWAVNKSIDVEFNPQLRTKRSLGLYTTLRFVDSAYSEGKLRMGYFKDNNTYVEKHHLPDNKHYGFEFNYESSRVIKRWLPKSFKDGLYINTTFLNDIDYLNLQKNALKHFGLTPLQESRLNYFAYNNDYYAGVNTKYFIDTRKQNNDETLQILPSIQLHKYLNKLIWNNLTYNVDFHINNFERPKGVTLRQAELKIPLDFTMTLLDDYLNLALGEEFYYSKFFFDNGVFDYKNYSYFSTIHKIKFFTDLSRRYDGMVHVLQPSISYLRPGTEREAPVGFVALNQKQRELFSVGLPEDAYDFSLSQYFYDTNMKLKFFQRLRQKYYQNREFSLADLDNEMQYNFYQWSLYSHITYAHEYAKIRQSSTRVSLTKPTYFFTIGHTFNRVLADMPTAIEADDVDFSFGYTISEKFKLNGGFTYSLNDEASKQWRIGGSYHRDCWNVAASLRQDITPRPTGFTKDNAFYIQFNFAPFGSIGTGSLP